MAEVQPLTALHYDQAVAGPLQDLVAPPYDVIDEQLRARLVRRSRFNIVRADLPHARGRTDAYAVAAQELNAWRAEGALVRDQQPAIWALRQDYTAPDGRALTRRGFLCRIRVEPYGAGTIRPHERTHPGPKEDRLRLTRATRANLSPIFALFSDPDGAAQRALQDRIGEDAPWGEARDDDGTTHSLWRVADPDAIAAVRSAAAAAELLIADGHHRYETARVYADEIGGEGPHRYVLACLVALQDPGLTVFPTHRLVDGLDASRWQALERALKRDFEREPLADPAQLVPDPDDERLRIGYFDARERRPQMLTLRDQAIADRALAERAAPYRRLDTAVLEALIVKGALGLSDEQIDHLDGLGYARDLDQALEAVRSGAGDAAFVMAPTPVAKIQRIAAAGENMPPKSTYFFPKILTGMVLNPLAE